MPKPRNYLVLPIYCTVVANPADGATAYIGFHGTNVTNTNTGVTGSMPVGCVIREAFITIHTTGTTATTESTSMYIRVNNTTDVTLSTAIQHNAAKNTYRIRDINLSLARGDDIMIKQVYPTWVTNPTNVHHVVTLVAELVP